MGRVQEKQRPEQSERLEDPNEIVKASGRIPPQDLDAEQAVLGAVLIDNRAWFDLPPELGPKQFYFTAHRSIYEAMRELIEFDQQVDILSLTNQLRARGEIEIAGGASYLAGLSDIVPSIANVAYYARIVVDKARRRGLAHLASEIISAVHDDTRGTPEIEAALDRGLLEIAGAATSEAIAVADVARQFRQDLEAARAGKVVELKTGLEQLDDIVHLQPGDFWLWAGRPANGKSVLGLQSTFSVAERGGRGLFVGLEMRARENFRRMVRARATLRREAAIKPVDDVDFERAKAASREIEGLPLHFLGNPDIDVILREATRVHRRHGLALLLVDYIQRVRVSSKHGMNRDAEIGEAAQRLKDWAALNEVPVIAIAAVNRESGKRKDPRPKLDDLRESGRLEYEANGVLFVHVPSKVAGTPESKSTATDDERRRAELIVAKQRDAEDCQIRVVRAEFEYCRFHFPKAAAAPEDVEV